MKEKILKEINDELESCHESLKIAKKQGDTMNEDYYIGQIAALKELISRIEEF